MLTTSFKNGIVQLANSTLDRSYSEINFHSPAIIQRARINRSEEERNIKRMSQKVGIYYAST